MRAHLLPHLSVLDIGCGAGAFLKSIQPFVARAAGWDPAFRGWHGTGAHGVDIAAGELSTFAAANREAFDVVSAFHVIEHLPRIQPILRLALECLRPGGSLFVSVPNRLRLSRASLEALDCPPHHISRWSPIPLNALGNILGLELLGLSFELQSAEDIRFYLRSSLTRRSQSRFLTVFARVGARIAFSTPLYRLYRRLGYLSRWGFIRLSILAHYGRPRSPHVPT
jgi:SAM-dependent methyltransferase